MLRTDDLDYELPADRIATMAVEPRDSAKLMVLKRSEPGFCEVATVADLPRFLRSGDLMVFNATRVIPARLVGRKPTGGRVEGLYLGPGPESVPLASMRTWIVMLGASHLHVGTEVELLCEAEQPSGVRLRLLRKDATEPTAWVVAIEGTSDPDLAILERCGYTPLPPYIRKARERAGMQIADQADRARYQTVYAQQDAGPSRPGALGGDGVTTNSVASSLAGSVAAPTAGLHFTPGLLDRLAAAGVGRAEVTLHVGTGTFKSVETEFVEQHPMHAEWCALGPDVPRRVEEAKHAGRGGAGAGRVIAVGTTAARTLESFAHAYENAGAQVPPSLSTRLLITPGYQWRWVDGMLTNFHLPRTTLLAMVASRLDSGEIGSPAGDGVERLKRAYAEALKAGFRFFSYGDAMLILP